MCDHNLPIRMVDTCEQINHCCCYYYPHNCCYHLPGIFQFGEQLANRPGYLVEYDMMLTKSQFDRRQSFLPFLKRSRFSRAAMTDDRRFWENGAIPYSVAGSFCKCCIRYYTICFHVSSAFRKFIVTSCSEQWERIDWWGSRRIPEVHLHQMGGSINILLSASRRLY